MSIAMRLKYKVERDAPLVTRMPVTLLMQGDEAAQEIVVEMLDGGAPMNLSGYSAVLYLRRADGQRVRSPGSVTGNAASVTLDAACYSVPGSYIASMVLSADGEDRTVLRLAGYVESDGEGPVIDPTGEIPGYDDLARAYAELEAAIKAAETATEAASDAAEEAGSKAEAAETAAGAANSAAAAAAQSAGLAGNASAAAASANAAAQKIEEMTVSASGLEEGSQPTAAISEQDGAKHIAFGIPAGATGPKGDTGATPDLSIGEVTTGAPGTQAAAAITGTAEAPVLNLTIPRGDAGEGDVSSVDSILPGDDGDVALSAVRYAAQTLTDTQQAQARENIGAGPPGRMLSFSLPVSGWAGSGPYTCAISESSATAKTAVVECVLTAATRANQIADIDWTTSAGSIALSTAVKPAGELAGYMILTEVQ